MNTSITARELFDQQRDKLALRWVAGQKGEHREIEAGSNNARRPSLAGYLNVIYPNKVQILGTEELAWLDSLDARQRWETIEKIIQVQPLALAISKNQSCPEDLRAAADESNTPLWISPKRGHELLNHLSYHLARTLAPRVTLHGVFMEIYSIGVLITGEAGSGKSELALELLSRGHRLVADDAPEFTQIAPDVLDGTCPELLQDLLEVRGLGVLNVRDMFGDTAVKKNKYLRLIVHLTRPMTEPTPSGYERLTGDSGSRHVLDLDVPLITLPVMPGRNLAVLTEAATRLHILRTKGIDPAGDVHRPPQQPAGATHPMSIAASTLMIVSGLSGSGKSVALKTFEDLDYYCSDNLPVELLPDFVRSRLRGNPLGDQRLAVGIDVRSRSDLTQLAQWRQAAQEYGIEARLLFFEASDEALLKRYADTRRRHPLSQLGLALPEAITRERELTAPLRAQADAIIDTSALNVHQLRRRVVTEFALGNSDRLSLLFESFAYKRGVPAEADFVFDARVLPNPHWDPELRPLTGRDAGVRDYLDKEPDVIRYSAQIVDLLDTWLPRLRNDTRSYVTIAFGCTGGKHRSVYLAERMARHAREQGWPEVATFHREQD